MNALRLLLTRLKADPAWGMENVFWLCGIFFPLGILLPRYVGITAAGVRLALLLAALGCAAGCLVRVYGRAFCRLRLWFCFFPIMTRDCNM